MRGSNDSLGSHVCSSIPSLFSCLTPFHTVHTNRQKCRLRRAKFSKFPLATFVIGATSETFISTGKPLKTNCALRIKAADPVSQVTCTTEPTTAYARVSQKQNKTKQCSPLYDSFLLYRYPTSSLSLPPPVRRLRGHNRILKWRRLAPMSARSRGTPQGAVLSPLIFNLAMKDVPAALVSIPRILRAHM